jgi:hypothetical protein
MIAVNRKGSPAVNLDCRPGPTRAVLPVVRQESPLVAQFPRARRSR